MGAVTRDTTLYDNLHVKKFIADARDHVGRRIKMPIDVTIISASSASDVYRVGVLPANCEVVDLYVVTDGLGASAGSSVDVIIGDATDDDRYLIAADFDVTGANGRLAITGMRFRPTADTIVLLKHDAVAVVGKKVKGWIEYTPGV